MRSEIILGMVLHDKEKPECQPPFEESHLMEEKEVYSPTDFINQNIGKIKTDEEATCSDTTNSAGSRFFHTGEDHLDSPSSKVQLTSPGITLATPFSNHKGVMLPGEIIRPIPIIPLSTTGFTRILSPPTYLENPPQLPVAPAVILGNGSSKDAEIKVSVSPPHLPTLGDQSEQENISFHGNNVHDCHWLNCTESFDSMESLVNHVNDHHVRVKRPDVDYQCKWNNCPRRGKGFNARYKMLIHIRTHTNEKPHKCPLCGKSFSRLENLKIHNRSHTGEKPYACPFQGCTKAYSNSSDRFKHVRTHQEDKPYVCKMPGCNKRYTDPSSLRKHVRTHGHFFRESEQLDSTAGHSTTSGAQNFHLEQVSLTGSVSTPTVSTLQTSTPPIFQFSPLVGMEFGGSVGRIIPLPGFSENPLLSSTVLVNSVLTNNISTQTDGVSTGTKRNSPTSNFIIKKEIQEVDVIDSDVDCQESPLDLTTSPGIPSVVQVHSQSPSTQEVGEVTPL